MEWQSPRPQPLPPDPRCGAKPGIHSLLLRECLLEGGAGEAPCPLVLQPLSAAGGSPWPAVGLAEWQVPQREWLCHPRATRRNGWSPALARGCCCMEGLLVVPWAGLRRLHEPPHRGDRVPRALTTGSDLAQSALLPMGRGGPQQDPKDKGTGMTRPGLAAAVAAAEPCQHEELLAEQPGDPAEEIGPFKRDSDK